MLQDAMAVLEGGGTLTPHPNTKATALHVAAAKGYIEVIKWAWAQTCAAFVPFFPPMASYQSLFLLVFLHLLAPPPPGFFCSVGWMWTAGTRMGGRPYMQQLTGDRRRCAACSLTACVIWEHSTMWWGQENPALTPGPSLNLQPVSKLIRPRWCPCRGRPLWMSRMKTWWTPWRSCRRNRTQWVCLHTASPTT